MDARRAACANQRQLQAMKKRGTSPMSRLATRVSSLFSCTRLSTREEIRPGSKTGGMGGHSSRMYSTPSSLSSQIERLARME